MKVSDLDYHLPLELIAQQPLADRSASRMLVVSRHSGQIRDRKFQELRDLLSPSDFLVLNNSRVFPARLLGNRDSGGRVEILLLRPAEPSRVTQPDHDVAAAVGRGITRSGQNRGEASQQREPVNPRAKNDFYFRPQGGIEGFLGPIAAGRCAWQALARPKRKLRLGSSLHFSPDLEGAVVATGPGEKVVIEFKFRNDFYHVLDKIGHVPLPPYIRRADSNDDRHTYQTVYAEPPGSVAAPTAGFHFNQATLDQLKERGIAYHFVTLHVGYGTFKPMKSESVGEHQIDPETFAIPGAAAAGIRRDLQQGRRLIAVGTTTTRVLESWRRHSPQLEPLAGETDLFIYPPFQFQMVEGLLTNFHLPRSSLFALVCALLGVELAHCCYRHAVQQRYRFYSYGDCMLIL